MTLTTRLCLRALTLLLASLVLNTVCDAQDWSQHRGDRRDARVDSIELLSWADVPPQEIWRRPLGESFAGLSVVGDLLFTMFADDETEYLGAFRTADGSEIWRLELGRRFDDPWGNGARSTPTVQGAKVIALGSFGRLVCVRATDGALLWQVSFPELEGVEPPDFGYSPSPLVVDDLVLSEVGGSDTGLIAAFRLSDGTKVWATEAGRAGYSSPIVLGDGERRQIVFMTRSAVLALDASGRTLWRRPFEGGTPFDLPIATPLAVGNQAVFASHRAKGGSVLIEIERTGDAFLSRDRWESRRLQSHLNAGVTDGDTLFGFDDATLRAVSAADAEVRWSQRGFGKGSLLLLGRHLIVLTEDGELRQIEARADEFVEAGRHRVFDGRTWTAPSFAGGVLYVRDAGELVALRLPTLSTAEP